MTARYLQGNNLAASLDNTGAIQYYLYNGHGDVTGLTDGSGIVTKTYAYDAFGNEINPGETDTNPFRYCGEYFDNETGSIYLRARYYEPETGRFMTEDPHWNIGNMIYGDDPYSVTRENEFGETVSFYIPDISAVRQSGNLYVYGVNNPTYYLDESGELAYPGEIHNQVVKHIANNYGYYKEQTIRYKNNPRKWGRADLISPDGQIWDVKPNKPQHISAGTIQVAEYAKNIWKNAPKDKKVELKSGGYIPSGNFVYSGIGSTYYVSYHFAGHGVIVYDYTTIDNWHRVKEAMVGTLVLAGVIYMIVQTGGAAAPALIPL